MCIMHIDRCVVWSVQSASSALCRPRNVWCAEVMVICKVQYVLQCAKVSSPVSRIKSWYCHQAGGDWTLYRECTLSLCVYYAAPTATSLWAFRCALQSTWCTLCRLQHVMLHLLRCASYFECQMFKGVDRQLGWTLLLSGLGHTTSHATSLSAPQTLHFPAPIQKLHKFRQLITGLGNAANSQLRQAVLSGQITPRQLTRMPSRDLGVSAWGGG